MPADFAIPVEGHNQSRNTNHQWHIASQWSGRRASCWRSHQWNPFHNQFVSCLVQHSQAPIDSCFRFSKDYQDDKELNEGPQNCVSQQVRWHDMPALPVLDAYHIQLRHRCRWETRLGLYQVSHPSTHLDLHCSVWLDENLELSRTRSWPQDPHEADQEANKQQRWLGTTSIQCPQQGWRTATHNSRNWWVYQICIMCTTCRVAHTVYTNCINFIQHMSSDGSQVVHIIYT